jgi:hypothetical protein
MPVTFVYIAPAKKSYCNGAVFLRLKKFRNSSASFERRNL